MASKIIESLRVLHNMTAEEYKSLVNILGREPTEAELGVTAAMWSEHCAYKSTRVWLKTLPTKGERVIYGPGENAGVVALNDDKAVVFKMESHNHPSFIEPYQGAATGVGGILRDVFTMGARPVANLNALRFGDPRHPRTRSIIAGVVAGIGGYGNCIGVPTVGGEVNFHSSYNGNCLVNCMTVGVVRRDRIFTSQAAGAGNPVVYVGAKTGRDGIRGATMASGEFTSGSEGDRPTVQVGDPFTEKLLLEACLELMETDAIIAIQDMGAAGLTSSAVEMASKGGLGIELDLDHVPLRAATMTAYEIMLSESQERMLMVLNPNRIALAEKIFHKWGLDCTTIGKLTTTGRIICKRHGITEVDIDVAALVDNAPELTREWIPSPAQQIVNDVSLPEDMGMLDVLLRLIGSPDLCSRKWIWEQYDRHVGADTAVEPGAADAAIVRVHGTNMALAMTTDCTPRYCAADPTMGGKQAVAESWRNLCAVGATPLAVTDNLNFGNPEKPLIMGQIVGAIKGMGEACLALDYPIVSGNCSLYNETDGKPILPAPVIGGVGLLENAADAMTISLKHDGESLIVLGETMGHVGQSLYLREIHGREDGQPPQVNLSAERRNGELVRMLIKDKLISACHDVADGGLLIALAEMALAGSRGAELGAEGGASFWFGEDQGRYIISTSHPDNVINLALSAGVPAQIIGIIGGESIRLANNAQVAITALRQAHEGWLREFMA